jgi:two-component system cell cycle sensor histidine kinase/response regulator CckA
MVMADPGQIEQVLLNLAVNARDAMPHGGVLEIETANVVLGETDAKNHRVRTPGPHVMLSVTDTGSGIAPELLDRIFEPFFTTKESGKGTGLGLATVHGIVQQSGGHCSVASEPGRGTTFSVYLPSRAGERDVAGESGQEDRPALHGDETILFVEDDSSLRTMACAVLRGAGYAVIEASDGLEALRLCGDTSVGMDLVISDMVMPVMDGRDLATHVQRLRPGVRTLLMSGYTRDALVHNPEQNPGAWFLEKPFTPDALQRKVREVLDRADTPEAA